MTRRPRATQTEATAGAVVLSCAAATVQVCGPAWLAIILWITAITVLWAGRLGWLPAPPRIRRKPRAWVSSDEVILNGDLSLRAWELAGQRGAQGREAER